jgi:hypothetical protein
MGKTWKELRDGLNNAPKGGGKNPHLTVGNYKLLVTAARLIRDEESKEETDPDKIRYQGLGVTFKVLESAGPGSLAVGVTADKAFWMDAPRAWQRDRNYKTLRAFIERLTGEDIEDLDDEFVIMLPGFVIYDQVVEGKDPLYPDHNWAHIPQTVEDVLANRKELENE